MKLSEVFNAKAVAANYTEAATNDVPYLGAGLFPAKKKAGLKLKWIKGHNGLAVVLAPSSLDTKATFRGREGVSINETSMAFFKEGMYVTEEDYQEILRVQDSNDEYAQDVLDRIFDDTTKLVRGADVVPEIMRMSLLAPLSGNVGITITDNGANYTYNYDPNGEWKNAHYLKITTAADKWDAPSTCDPIKTLETALDAQEDASGNRPEIVLLSKATFEMMKASTKLRSNILAQNVTANVNYTTARVKSFIEEELNVTLIIYNKKYKDADGTVHNFYADNIVMLLPSGQLGNTHYGTTPTEARAKLSKGGDPDDNFAIVNTGVTIKTVEHDDPENTETIVSEVVLPSFERLDECYAVEVA